MKRTPPWVWPLLLAVLVVGGWYFGFRSRQSDRELPVYVTAGERMARGEEIYRRGVDAKPFTYPPFAAVPFVPFAWIPRDWQPAAWFAVNFAILVLLVRWLHRFAARELPGAGPPRLVWFWVLTAVLGGRHVWSVLSNQSHDLFIAGLVGLCAASWCRARSLAGLWAGLGGAVKATPLLFVGLFGLRRDFVGVLLLVVAFVAATMLPDWWFPRADGGSWWRQWFDVNLRGLDVGGTASAHGAWNSHSFLNQSLTGTLTRLFQPVRTPDANFVVGDTGHVLLFEMSPGLFRVVSAAAQLAVLAVLTWGVIAAVRVSRAVGDRVRAAGLVGLGEVTAFACGMVLLSPQSSKAHFCVWLFPAAFLADRLLRGRRDPAVVVLASCAFVVGLVSKDLFTRELGNTLLAFGNVTWCTVLLLLATVRCLSTTRVEAQA